MEISQLDLTLNSTLPLDVGHLFYHILFIHISDLLAGLLLETLSQGQDQTSGISHFDEPIYLINCTWLLHVPVLDSNRTDCKKRFVKWINKVIS